MVRRKAVSAEVSEKAQGMAAPEPAEAQGQPKAWDEANPTFSFRIRPEDADRLAAAADSLGVSKDALARGLMWAALDALDAGRLHLEVSDVVTRAKDSRGRVRSYARRIVAPAGLLE